jgi:polyphosphate kinase 2
MSKKHHLSDEDYEAQLAVLQLALVKTQIDAMKKGERICLVLEGRDGAGKDGLIKRVVEHLSVRQTRVIALPKPNEREQGQWWFARYAARLPTTGEFVLFNRSWYNRGGVEVVMGFSKPEQQEQFLRDAPDFERMLIESGVKLVKIWLDISKDEQKTRLDDRRSDPLKQLKVSDMDKVAQAKWDEYSAARDAMLTRTHTPMSPWICVAANSKKRTRLEVLRYLIRHIAPSDIAEKVDAPDPEVLFPFEISALTDGRLEK